MSEATGSSGGFDVVPGHTPTEMEIDAARRLAALGYRVLLRPPAGRRSPTGQTSDLLVDGVTYDVYSPRTSRPSNIISEVAHKGSQAHGVVLDLSHTVVTAQQLGDVMMRVRRTGSRLQNVIILE